VQAIHTLASGKKYLSPEIAQKLVLRDFATDRDAARSLSAREFEVLQLLTQGNSIREIAQALGLNAKTVANHQSVIKQKLGVATAMQLLTKAGELGLVQSE
jgi:DNA-binding NarL/FixJ family response regulator